MEKSTQIVEKGVELSKHVEDSLKLFPAASVVEVIVIPKKQAQQLQEQSSVGAHRLQRQRKI